MSDETSPGPWQWDSYNRVICKADDVDCPDCAKHHKEHPASLVAWVPASYGDSATGRHAADARLIAAAPEMLAALERILEEAWGCDVSAADLQQAEALLKRIKG